MSSGRLDRVGRLEREHQMGLFGGTAGIGRAIAQQLAERGDQVCPLGRSGESLAKTHVIRTIGRPDLHGGRQYLSSLRHAYYVKSDVYAKALDQAISRLS